MTMTPRAYLLHALSPLHAGTGQSVGHIDLPIARYRATQIPFVPGSTMKGVLRDALEPPPIGGRARARGDADHELHRTAFGPAVAGEDPAEHSGAVTFGDARLLLLPVRSLRGTFAYATSPLLLRLAREDLGPDAPPAPELETAGAHVPQGSLLGHGDRVFFEEIDRTLVTHHKAADPICAWATYLGDRLFGAGSAVLRGRFAVVDDELMSFLWETCTQVDARVRLAQETHVVEDGALWYEESLPPETVLVGLAAASRPRRTAKADPKAAWQRRADTPTDLLDYCLGRPRADLQFGGKATVGRGRARLLPLVAAAAGEA